MPALTATATCTAYRALVEATGELVGSRLLVQRVRWLAAFVQELAAPLLAAHWTETDLEMLAAGVGPDGRRLPASGWMTMRRLGWAAPAGQDLSVCDRVRRIAEEAAARTFRVAVYRRAIVRAILATWPADPRRRTDQEWAALRKQFPAGTTSVEIRNRTRQIAAWQADHDGRLPAGLAALETPPEVAAVVLLAAADKQLTTIARSSADTVALRVQLPLTARPATRTDWAWHVLPIQLPVTVPADAAVCSPSLRVVKQRVRVDLPYRQSIPVTAPRGHSMALGLDWGVNTALTGTVGRLVQTPSGVRVVTDGRRLQFDATGVSAKLHRLRGHREHLAAKCDQYVALLGGLPEQDPSEQRAWLEDKHAVLAVEHEHVCARIRRLNHALAWAAARWAVDQARALGATVVYVEDLSTLEARGRRNGNARLSGQVRGVIVEALEHLAAKVGIPMVTVPARGTSKFCPRCGGKLAHVAAPDRPSVRGWKWAVCSACGLSSDRDHAAAERIVARGLLSQQQVRTDSGSGRHMVTKSVDGNVARARRAAPKPKRRTRAARRADRPTPPSSGCGHRNTRSKRRRPPPATRTTVKTSRRVPDRHAVPALPSGLNGSKRPAGQAPQTTPPPAASHAGRGRSDPAHDPLPLSLHCRQRRDPGWGFHRNVTATPVIRLGNYGPVTARPRPTVRVA